jgi:DNA-damage-inducible protein J
MSNLTIRIDKTVKGEAERLFSELGLNMSTAINLFVRQALRQRKIPFEIAAGENRHPVTGFVIPPGEENDPFWNDSNQRALQRSIEAAERGELTEHEPIEVE